MPIHPIKLLIQILTVLENKTGQIEAELSNYDICFQGQNLMIVFHHSKWQ